MRATQAPVCHVTKRVRVRMMKEDKVRPRLVEKFLYDFCDEKLIA